MNERRAVIEYRDAAAAAADLERVRAYMPSNYTAGTSDERIIISGHDNAGWTLDGYVIPRLASGLIVAREVSDDAPTCPRCEDLLSALRALVSTARTFRNVPKDEQEWTSIDDLALEQAFDAIERAERR